MCRGNAGQRVFIDARDHTAFLERLAKYVVEFAVEVHAYALMSNHVHLLLRTNNPNLSRFMQRLLSSYTQWFHKRHQTYGHLFQGRYKALIVEREGYGTEVSRYIHLNPVRVAGSAQQPAAKRRAALRAYVWSSYRAFVGLAPCPSWLTTRATLAEFGSTLRDQQRAYACYVEEGLLRDISDPAERAVAQSIIGSEEYASYIRRIIQERRSFDRESAPVCRRICSAPLQVILQKVADACNTSVAQLTTVHRGRKPLLARQIALWAAYEYCSAIMSARAIGAAMGGISAYAVTIAHQRISAKLHKDPYVQRIARAISFGENV